MNHAQLRSLRGRAGDLVSLTHGASVSDDGINIDPLWDTMSSFFAELEEILTAEIEWRETQAQAQRPNSS